MKYTHTKASEVKAGDIVSMGNELQPMTWTAVANNKSNNRRLPVAITFTTEFGHEVTVKYGYTAKFWVKNK